MLAAMLLSKSLDCYVVWLCYDFKLSHRDIEGLLAEGGITVSRSEPLMVYQIWCYL